MREEVAKRSSGCRRCLHWSREDPEMIITDEWLIAELNQSVITLQYKGQFPQPLIHSSSRNGGQVKKEKKVEIIKFLSSIKNMLRYEGVNTLKIAFPMCSISFT
ncbi:hypothetical protein AAES_95711 [Amazona aestiva]|uniref:Uncharacterized protein n=1 Tax=Amazona aestiva TaxID=12930 RepID=A0A0Q3USA1_AMAAE|nr:hypothetical protein AAES_95711 [Amazona aestiva]